MEKTKVRVSTADSAASIPDPHKTYVPPTTPLSGYSFVAAAALYRSFGGICVYIKHKGGTKGKIIVKESSAGHAWFICPDREIVIVRNNYEMGAFHPWGDSFDECVHLSMFDDAVSKKLGIEYIMTNYAHSKDSMNSRIKARSHPDSRITVLSDSGGLQLSRDVSALIHPKDLITFYNNNVDAGMCLDIPLAGTDNREMLLRAARLQQANTEIMIDNSQGVELLNIFHGKSYDARRAFREVVEDPRINRCAIGGVYHEKLLTSVNSIYSLAHEGQRYKQYHVLGVFIATHIPILVKLANAGDNPPHITSDSTSHIQSAANRAYHFQFDILHTSKRIAIGTRGAVLSTERLLPCQCLVCQTLKYTDILAFGQGRIVTELLAIHNAAEMSRYSRQLQLACEQLPPKEFNKLVENQLHRNPGLPEVKASLDFIEIAVEQGLEKARQKYSGVLSRGKEKQAAPPVNGLFGANVMGGAEPEVVESTEEKTTRFMKLMTSMEDQIGIGQPRKARRISKIA